MWDSKVAAQACELLELHEGRRTKPYKDTVGKWTIGIGFNLDDIGLLDDEMDVILRMRLGKLWLQLEKRLPGFLTLDVVRQLVLLDMAYNLGMDGLLKFRNTLALVQKKDYEKAADEMLNSKWARQVGSRARRLSAMMRTGKLPWDEQR